MKRLRYILVPGHVLSRDGQLHYISASRLVDLYGLDRRECILVDGRTAVDGERSYLRGLPRDLPILHPREDGNYTLAIAK